MRILIMWKGEALKLLVGIDLLLGISVGIGFLRIAFLITGMLCGLAHLSFTVLLFDAIVRCRLEHLALANSVDILSSALEFCSIL